MVWIPKVHDLWRPGLGRREAQRRMAARLTTLKASAAKFFVRAGRATIPARRMCGWLDWPGDGAEWGGDFFKPRMALDGFGQFLNAEINGALADAVPVGVVVNPR